MPNMSYCRFENTYRNLVDCAQAMNETLSESERKYKEKLVNVCQEIIEEYELNNLAEWNETEYGDNDENDNDVSWDTQTK
jgi:hypothetical protein